MTHERRPPEPWESGEGGPFLTIGNVSVVARGGDRFVVSSPNGDRQIEGFERARTTARELARISGRR